MRHVTARVLRSIPFGTLFRKQYAREIEMEKETESSAPRRLQILGEEEVASIYERPLFTHEGDQSFSGAGCEPGVVNKNDTVRYQ